ncbi:MAG TPA: hypothetical protein VIU13_13405 [Chryseolinea sp.]
MKEGLKKIVYKNREILIIDYLDYKESGMIDLVTAARELILKENKKVLLLSILNDKTYLSPRFIRHVDKELTAAEQLIERNAATGLSNVQQWYKPLV